MRPRTYRVNCNGQAQYAGSLTDARETARKMLKAPYAVIAVVWRQPMLSGSWEYVEQHHNKGVKS